MSPFQTAAGRERAAHAARCREGPLLRISLFFCVWGLSPRSQEYPGRFLPVVVHHVFIVTTAVGLNRFNKGYW